MLVINRFRVPELEVDGFLAQADEALTVLRDKPGLVSLDLVQNLDEPELWALVGNWADVGSYRRALGGFETKMAITPLLHRVIDEPSAYADPSEVGVNLPRARF